MHGEGEIDRFVWRKRAITGFPIPDVAGFPKSLYNIYDLITSSRTQSVTEGRTMGDTVLRKDSSCLCRVRK